jgi:hypothetical protein
VCPPAELEIGMMMCREMLMMEEQSSDRTP